ncbi:terpenoid cyclases/protein prenyltransferase alpha-alpha toroid [Protomyces lactucae-debilis]|uniref:Terpene cyclase/mutase family member n=1 Tax=Protomyces lactucae-debilis TaxID=2754530 RepID=A0A1Y2F6N0_PROLT|nr:terpenoid cyclases/protein prenyltransferase alpha-alpha toroid [Protomyces lactucae-debilis]ORY79552.1 terpenoid cyclases/protein prenyltransferase alpha-alpha toroid [Protomyces lactucae-debilis]
MTDRSRWRLSQDVTIGVQRWEYLSPQAAKKRPLSLPERYFLNLPIDPPTLPKPKNALDASRNGFEFYRHLQLPDGHWGCFYGGPSFLLPGFVIALYVAEQQIPDPQRLEMIKFLRSSVNEDGGWGMHLAGPSTVFGTALYYVSGRILGLDASDPLCIRARETLLSMGGATGIPQWGKFWLATLGLFDWDGINPVPTEFWLLPDWVPLHPWRWWIHTRVVYLPMSYIFCNRFTMPSNDLTRALKQELYSQPFEQIVFANHRNNVSEHDILKRHSLVLRIINVLLVLWFKYLRPQWLHEKANELVRHLIHREDQNTGYACIAPVNAAMHILSNYWSYGPDSEQVKKQVDKIWDYMWIDGTGMTASGTNGVQLWDTAFSVSCLVEAGLSQEKPFQGALDKALDFLDKSQFRDDLADPYRQRRKGGWPFSTVDNGYIVSDCTAEGLKAFLLLQENPQFANKLADERLFDCVDTLLSMQNANGGFASYELVRGSQLLELLNPAEVFDRIMVEYCYVECTSAVNSALSLFQQRYPVYRATELAESRRRAVEYIVTEQRADGSFYGSWGICFTYGTMFAVEALVLAGMTYADSPPLRRAIDFILSKQMDDGGWGESYLSSESEQYVHSEQSLVVQTSWALIALVLAAPKEVAGEAMHKAVRLLMSRQTKTGEWLQEETEGVFNRTCMIGYPNYRHYFPIKALGLYSKHIAS